MSGDFDQFEPLGNTWEGSDAPSAEHSSLLHHMARGNVLKLTECKRSDSRLFDFYSCVLSTEQTVALLVESAKGNINYLAKFVFT